LPESSRRAETPAIRIPEGASPVQFDHVFIGQEVIPVDHLALEFPVPPDARVLELGKKIMVDMCRQVEQAGAAL